MSKLGGGTSGYFGNIRHRGASVKNNGKASGSVHIMQLFETMVDVVSQGSVRRGRFSPYLPVEHSDIEEFLDNDKYDSARAVQLCKEHPGKMWTVEEDNLLKPLDLNLKFEYEMHEAQYQDLPEVYIQTSSLEIADVKKINKYGNRSGKTIMPIFCEGINSFSIDYEFEFSIAEKYLNGEVTIF